MSAGCADAGAALLRAAQEFHGDADAACARRLVRDISAALGRTTREVMGWTLRRLASEGLVVLAPA